MTTYITVRAGTIVVFFLILLFAEVTGFALGITSQKRSLGWHGIVGALVGILLVSVVLMVCLL